MVAIVIMLNYANKLTAMNKTTAGIRKRVRISDGEKNGTKHVKFTVILPRWLRM